MNRLSHGPCEILGLPRGATDRQIKRAYRRLAKRLHPDQNPDDPESEERFKEVQWAYETLMARNKQEGLPATPFSGTTHPFHGFFQAVRAYYAERKHTKQTSPKGRGEQRGEMPQRYEGFGASLRGRGKINAVMRKKEDKLHA